MTSNKQLEPFPANSTDLVVHQPPEAFEVVDLGSAETVRFDNLGDTFVGIFMGTEEITGEDGEVFEMATFTGADGHPYCIFPGASLKRALRRLEPKQWARITYTRDIDTGRPSPLKSYVVEVGR